MMIASTSDMSQLLNKKKKEDFMIEIRKTFVVVLLIVGLSIGFSSISHADFALSLFDGTTTVTIFDGGAGDANTVPGAITYVGSMGVWTVNVTSVLGYPELGSAAAPKLDLNTVNNSGSEGTMTIKASQTSFTAPASSPLGLNFEVGGTTSGSVTFKEFVDTNNALFAGSQVGSTLAFGYSPFSGTTSGGFIDTNGLYSITAEADIVHRGAGSTSFNAGISVPEPFTLIFLGSCLLGAGMVSRKFRKI
jgi:hypothetical protein